VATSKRATKIPSISTARIQKIIRSTLNNVLCAPSRRDLLQIQQNRFMAETSRVFRMITTKYIDVQSVDQQIFEISQKFGTYLNPPLDSIEECILAKLVAALSKYLNLFVEAGTITLSPKNIVVFTSIMCDKFSTGWVIENKTVVERLDLFARHAPPEIYYGSIPELDINCRSMSSMTRKLQQEIIGSGNCAPKLKYCLRVVD
jgi:hypothetical protein